MNYKWPILAVLLIGLAGFVCLTAPGFELYGRTRELISGGPQYSPTKALPAVHSGSPLAWRRVLSQPLTMLSMQGCLGSFHSGNFDSDADDEALLIGRQRSYIIEANGTIQPCGLSGPGFTICSGTFDYDGDGIEELIPDAIGYKVETTFNRATGKSGPLPTSTPIFDLNGRRIADLPELTSGTDLLLADFNGDGQDELLNPSMSIKPLTLKVYGHSGSSVGQFNVQRGLGGLAADTDGDGRAEYLRVENKPYARLCVYNLGGKQGELPIQTFGVTRYSAADLNGDGRDEILSPTGWLDPATQHFTNPVYPAETVKRVEDDWQQRMNEAGSFDVENEFNAPLVGDFLPAAGMEVAIASNLLSCANCLCIYDAGGQLLYHEVFRDNIWQMVKLRAGGKDYLALQQIDRVLMYP